MDQRREIEEHCAKCGKLLPEDDIVIHCYNCNNKYHHTTCCSLASSTYKGMSKSNRANWLCKFGSCAKRDQSPNLSMVFENIRMQKKQRREDSEDSESSSVSKKHRRNETVSLALASDINETKKNISEIKEKMSEFSEIKKAISNLNTLLETMNKTIADLREENRAKDKTIEYMQEKINVMEQTLIEKNVEVKNANEVDEPIDLVMLLASKANANIAKHNIVDVYRQKRSKKIIVKFDTIVAKKEFTLKVKAQKIKSGELKTQNGTYAEITNQRNETIFVNDELTALNKKLLWMAKNKARSKNWKFVWVRNGKILAKKSENDRACYITKEADIGLIN